MTAHGARADATIVAADHCLDTPRGALFARTWTPASPSAGAPILLLHDSLGCVALWRDFPLRLAAATGRLVAAYDRLGFGRSAPHPGPPSPTFIQDEARDVVPLVLDALGLRDPVLFGHSVGGGIGVATAAELGDACTALVSESAQAFVEERTLDGLRAAEATFREPRRMERLERYHGEKARWVLDAWLGTWLDPAHAGWHLDADAARVRCPSLFLHGELDEYGSPAHPRRLAAHVRGPVRVEILAGVGHVPHREQPARILDEVTRFLGTR